jgi:Fe-S oxidoreductase
MKIIFLQQLWYEWQAPMIFSAIAKEKGHCTVMHIKPDPVLAAQTAIDYGADLIVFASIASGNMKYVYECAKAIKRQCDIPIIAGGVHISLFYRDISMQNINYLGVGEGEITFSAFLDYLENKISIESVPGLAYLVDLQIKTNAPKHVIDMDDIPVIDRDLYYKHFIFRKEKVRMFYSGRGCLHNCSYCCVPILNKIDSSMPAIRKRTPSNLINEILDVKKRYGLKASFFQDDTFTQDKRWLKQFLPLYKKHINKPLMCMSRAADLDEDIIDLLANNGCVGVGIGIETANEANRKTLLNRLETNSQIVRVINLLRERKVKVTTFNMIGIPGETKNDFDNTIRFNQEIKVDSAWGVLFQPYINTDLFNVQKKSKEASGNFYSELGYDCPEKQQIELLQKLFPLSVCHPRLAKALFKIAPGSLAYFMFSFYSFYREIRIWKRSFIITLITGLKNQVQYKKNK